MNLVKTFYDPIQKAHKRFRILKNSLDNIMILFVVLFTNCLFQFSYGDEGDLEKPNQYEDNCCEEVSFNIEKNKYNIKFIKGLKSKPSGNFFRTEKSRERRHMDAKDTLRVCSSMKINDNMKKRCNNSQYII